MPRPETYSASFAFFEGLYEAGVSHVFVNLGSDHPAIMEALAQGAHLEGVNFPRVITCPHEMVAMSMADGFARLTGKPQCVLVHVDVGTQMLGCAMHNASVARCPVFVFAGLSPFTQEGEMRGSRTEYIHWLQDAPDQKQIVSQFCRYTGEFKTAKNVKQMLNRALQFATSDPKGPVYMVGAREVMEEEIPAYSLDQSVWENVAPTALPQQGVETIVELLAGASSPLIITGYSGRNHATVPELVKLAEAIPGVQVLDALGSDVCFPFSHRASLGVGIGRHPRIEKADVILVLDCDVAWIPTQCTPRADAKIVHVDVDPLKSNMPLYYISAFRRYRADAETALRQLNTYVAQSPKYANLAREEPYTSRWSALAEEHQQRLAKLAEMAAEPQDPSMSPNTSYLCAQLRQKCPKDTIWCLETVTNAPFVYQQLQVDEPGHLINAGGGGLGWSGGATIGVKLASDWLAGGQGKGKFVTEIVGDGTYMFGVPGTVYWVARRYELPTLTVVLSNKGWNAPRNSLELVHPTGYGSKISNKELNISFDPTPDYSGIAKAAAGGNAWAGVAATVQDLTWMLPEAIEKVQSGISAILEVRLAGSW
ncbi:Acetolactate synthase catalytic subunit [Pleurostoma richardsiae]|uniref:Acetolactate synthase catalytic subunit n=1 Tax=Pleurostoma richardsiae TaxID=41990 RepID=A0AA38VJU3_9PEZI|nr:Acetolactate synthase catalytic subunit [Pleurostoma richardsiae]